MTDSIPLKAFVGRMRHLGLTRPQIGRELTIMLDIDLPAAYVLLDEVPHDY